MEIIRVAFVTIPVEKANEMAQTLVKNRFAACVNVVPEINSFYWDNENIEDSREALLIIKTTNQKIEALTDFVAQNHPYDIPEVITIPVAEGLPRYISWVIEEMGKRG